MEGIYERLKEIVHDAQLTSSKHQKCALQLKKLYKNNDLEIFFSNFKKYLNFILLTDYKYHNVFVERSIEFIAYFCEIIEMTEKNEENIESDFLCILFDFLLNIYNNYNDIVRFRCCQMITKILQHLLDNELSMDLCDKIEAALLERLEDGKQAVRMQAALALYHLQDPSNEKCPIITSYIRHMQYDNSAKVRKICVEKIALRADVTSHIILRTRDVNIQVRLAAYARGLCLPQHFKIVERQNIIKNGLKDENNDVKNFVAQHLISAWLQYFDNNYIELMKAVRLDSDEKDITESVTIVEYLLIALFQTRPRPELFEVLEIDDNRLIPVDKLNWETVLYWRFFLEHLRKFDEYDEAIQNFIPEFPQLCKYIQQYYMKHKLESIDTIDYEHSQFILTQLFEITNGYDFLDSAHRICLNSLITDILENGTLSENTIVTIVLNLNNSVPNENDQARFVCELISQILNAETDSIPEETEIDTFEIAKLKVKLNCLQEDQQVAIKESDFTRAEELKNEIENIQETIKSSKQETEVNEVQKETKPVDVGLIVKCLDIANALLLMPKIRVLNPMLRTLKDNMIQDWIMYDDDTVRYKALKSYALCCILDKNTASVGIHLFCAPIDAYNSGESCDTRTILVAIGAIVDMIMLFGSNLIANPTDNNDDSFDEQHESIFKGGSSLTSVVQGLVDLMQDENPEIQEVAGRGLCNLILTGRVYSPSVISQLILKWCNPCYDGELNECLKQRIGILLEKLPTIPDSADELEGAVLPTIRTLVKAPKKSPLTDVNVENIAKFLIGLCGTHVEGPIIHSNLLRIICKDMITKPRAKENVIYSKMLHLLPVSEKDKEQVNELLELCEDIRDKIGERIVLNNVIKFITKLTTLKSPVETILEENEENVDETNIDENQENNHSNYKISKSNLSKSIISDQILSQNV